MRCIKKFMSIWNYCFIYDSRCFISLYFNSKLLLKAINYKYLLSILANAMIKAVKKHERIGLEIVYLFVSGMLSVGVTVVPD